MILILLKNHKVINQADRLLAMCVMIVLADTRRTTEVPDAVIPMIHYILAHGDGTCLLAILVDTMTTLYIRRDMKADGRRMCRQTLRHRLLIRMELLH